MDFESLEKWDRSELQEVINADVQYPSSVMALMLWAIMSMHHDNNSIPVTFTEKTPGNDWATGGRRYSKGGHSLQNAPKWLRRRVSPRDAIEIDIVNCHPTIFYHHCYSLADLNSLKYYNNNRDTVLDDISLELHKSKSEIKRTVCAIINGGSWRRLLDIDKAIKCKYLDVLQSEVRAAREILLCSPELCLMKRQIKDSIGDDSVASKALSLFLQREERKAIDAIIDECMRRDIQVGSILHDGIIIYSERQDDICEIMSSVITLAVGFPMHCKTQSLNPIASDFNPYPSADRRHSRILYKDDQYVSTPVFSVDEKCICIKAGMGSGKTHAMLDFFKTQFKHKERALLITGRINQADSLEGLFTKSEDGSKISVVEDAMGNQINVYLYNDCEDSVFLRKKQPGIFIIQWESLHKIMDETNSYYGFNYLFIDEVRTVINQSCSAITNKNKLRVNMNLFKDICQKTMTIMMDADILIDDAVKNLVYKSNGGFWEDDEVRFEVYTRQSMDRQIKICSDEDKWLASLIESVETSKREREGGFKAPTFVAVRSKRAMHDIIYSICGESKPEFLSNGIAYFSSESTSLIMSSWKDINKFITDNEVDLIITTSKVTVCADIQVPIRKCYVHASSQGFLLQTIFLYYNNNKHWSIIPTYLHCFIGAFA
jgi:hypothetical protein